MSAAPRPRYPGAHSFADDELSREVFFGRKGESARLADQIMANRLVVVFGRSGLGKTSLLNAGVAERLRQEHFLPLTVRVNDVKNGPERSVWEGIEEGCRRQRFEYVPGSRDSLWHFFKTAQFWDQDVLMTPVLILDQFEELFTLQSGVARSRFVGALGQVFKAVEPRRPHDGSETLAELTEKAPTLRVVISVREDFLGELDELSGHIPEILDCRFRVVPLSAEAARLAIREPANVQLAGFETKPFTIDDKAVDMLLAFLAKRSKGSRPDTKGEIEPFQLQLICQRIEEIAKARQAKEGGTVLITPGDVGSVRELSKIVRRYYRAQLHAIHSWRERRQVAALCESELISPEGRRLSLDGGEITRKYKVSEATLIQLVDGRLLRPERRADSVYYELSHDCLVLPIVGTGRLKYLLQGVTCGIVGIYMLLTALSAIFFIPWSLSLTQREEMRDWSFVAPTVLGAICLAALGLWGGPYLWRKKREFMSRARIAAKNRGVD